MTEKEKTTMAQWEVMVGNIGAVFIGENGFHARSTYNQYVAQSKALHGRASGEAVILLRDGDIHTEHVGTVEN